MKGRSKLTYETELPLKNFLNIKNEHKHKTKTEKNRQQQQQTFSRSFSLCLSDNLRDLSSVCGFPNSQINISITMGGNNKSSQYQQQNRSKKIKVKSTQKVIAFEKEK